jgi:hypothetical protein
VSSGSIGIGSPGEKDIRRSSLYMGRKLIPLEEYVARGFQSIDLYSMIIQAQAIDFYNGGTEEVCFIRDQIMRCRVNDGIAVCSGGSAEGDGAAVPVRGAQPLAWD